MKKMGVWAAVGMGLLWGGGYVYADGNGVHAEALKPSHGGQVQAAGANVLELVVAKGSKEASDQPVLVFLTDGHGKKLSSTGATGTATLLSGKDKTVIPLSPDGDNRMKGMGKYASNPSMKAIVAIAFPGKGTEQARFTPLAAGDGHKDHTH